MTEAASILTIDLAPALALAAKVTPAYNSIPILGHVMLRATDDLHVELVVNDLVTEVVVALPRSVAPSHDFAVTLPVDRLRKVLAKAPKADAITVRPTPGTPEVALGIGKLNAKLLGYDPSDFPNLRHAKGPAVSCRLPVRALAVAFEATAFCVSTESTRYYLNGVHLARDGDEPALSFRATEGHRIARHVVPLVDCPEFRRAGYIIPTLAVNLVQSIAADAAKRVTATHATLTLDDGLATFEIGGVTVRTRLVDGQFPDVRRLIPTNPPIVAAASVPALIAAVAAVSSITAERQRAIKVDVNPIRMIVSARDPDYGSADMRVEADANAAIEFGVNGAYLTGVLERCGDGEVEIGIVASEAPIRFAPTNGAQTEYVIMPMRV